MSDGGTTTYMSKRPRAPSYGFTLTTPFPVKFSAGQLAAIEAAAQRAEVSKGHFIREAALARIAAQAEK